MPAAAYAARAAGGWNLLAVRWRPSADTRRMNSTPLSVGSRRDSGHPYAWTTGSSVDGSVRTQGADPTGLARLLLYCARPPFALGHLHQRDAEPRALPGLLIQRDFLRIVTPARQESAIDGWTGRQPYSPKARWVSCPFDINALRETMDKLRDKLKSAAVVLASKAAGKVTLIAGVTPDLTARVKAGEMVNMVAQQVGGKGGRRPDMVQEGGTQPENLPAALASVNTWVEQKL